jgi:2-dehydropantoate 2-reductase
LQILSPIYGDFTVRPRVVIAAAIPCQYDVILLSVKSYSLAAAIDDFAPSVGPRTAIIPVLNGMQHMDALRQRFGEKSVLDGVCFVATEIDTQGRIIQLADFQNLTYGELDGKKTSRIEAVHDAFHGAGFDTAISKDICRDMWQKWVFLASLGAVTCLLDGNIGEIAAVHGGADLSLSVLRECAAIAGACGYSLSEAFLAEKSSQLTAPASSMTSSMYRNLKEQAPIEADSILGDLIELGRKHGVSTPLLQAALVRLTIYQRELAAVKAAGS